jgi:hypothetical protein
MSTAAKWTPERRARFEATMQKKREASAAKVNGPRWRNVTLDADLVQSLNGAADRLRQKFGFRPTLSQTVRYLVNVKGRL